MESDEDRASIDLLAGRRVPLELIGEGLFLAALVIAPWIYGSVEDTARYALCAGLLLAACLFLWPDLRERRLPRGAPFALLLPAFALAQTTLGQSVAPTFTLEAALVAFSMAMVWAAIDARAGSTSTNTGRRLALALLLVCGCEAAFAAFQWSTDRQVLFGARGAFQTAPFGSYVNHNNFAGLVSLGVPLAIAMAIGDLRRSGVLTPRGLSLMGLACALGISVLASGSRGGMIALVLGLLSLALIARRFRRQVPREGHHHSWLGPLTLGLGVLLIATLAIPSSTRARLASVFDKGGSAGYRIDIGRAAFRAFSGRPLLGSGLGAFADAAAPFKTGHGDYRSERAEADLIEFGVEGGLVLMAGLFLFGRFAWRSAEHEMIQGRDRSGRWLRAGAVASCVTMLLHSFFDFGFRIPANAFAFAVVLGIATAGSARAPIGKAWRSRGLILLLAVLAAASAYRSVGAARERAALARASAESRLDALQGLVDTHPYLDQARRQRGLAWTVLAYSQGQYDPSRLERARADFEALVRARPQWAEVRIDLGWVNFYEGKRTEARAEMQTATRLDPTHMGVGLAYAQVLAWTGDTPAAVEELARLRRMNPVWTRERALELAASWTKDPALLANIP